MKKSIIILAGLVGLALTSCDDTSDLGTMQKNEEPVIVPADGIAVKSLYSATGGSIDLNDYPTGVEINLLKVAFNSKFAETTTVAGTLEIASVSDFSDAQTVSLKITAPAEADSDMAAAVGGEGRQVTGYVWGSDWEDAFFALYGYDSEPQTNYIRYQLYLIDDTQVNVIYSDEATGETWWPAQAITVTPLPVEAPVYEYYYATGDSNSWGFANNWLAESGDDVWGGYAGLSGSFKITSEPGWTHPYWGLGNEPGTLGEGDEYGNIPVETPGLYYLKADMANLVYTLDPITEIGIIGGFADNNWVTSVAELTQTDFWTWTCDYEFTSDTVEWKFWMNNAWDYNLGGEYGNLIQNGGNLKAPGIGVYTITLNFATIPYTVTFTPK